MTRTNLDKNLPGALWMLLAMSLIAIVDGLAKYIALTLNGVQVAWGYFLGMLVSLLIYNAWHKVSPLQLIRSTRPLLQLGRTLCMVGSIACLFYSLRFLPLVEATSISFTSSLFLVALASPTLGEHVTWGRWIAVLVGFAGALLIVRPGSAIFQWAALIPLIGAFFFALFQIFTKRLSGADDPMTTLFYTFAGGTLLLCATLPFVWTTPGPEEWSWFMFSGMLGMVAHFSIVRALTYANASLLAPINYIRIIWATGIGFFVFGQLPDALALLGGFIVIGSGLYVGYSAQRVR